MERYIKHLKDTLVVKVNLRLTHFPYAIEQVNPAALLNNSTMRNHGQLISIKLARVVNIFPPQYYLYSKVYQRACHCQNSPPQIIDYN